jgi:5'(3')-deoxyribonucleotidase
MLLFSMLIIFCKEKELVAVSILDGNSLHNANGFREYDILIKQIGLKLIW